jgi:hypothetical protein
VRRTNNFVGLAILALAIAGVPEGAGGQTPPEGQSSPGGRNSGAAESLTRSNCWTATYDNGARRTLCFAGSGRVKMTNYAQTSTNKGWSSCEWSGQYTQSDTKVTVAFAQGSGKCSNKAASPQWSVTCEFSGNDLDCQGSAIVDGKVYEVKALFK